jgi:2-keto-4-pentenoate hydratase/2-oxohepta-3-ene-1,7-dioic acid hydratase in catechol pathway
MEMKSAYRRIRGIPGLCLRLFLLAAAAGTAGGCALEVVNPRRSGAMESEIRQPRVMRYISELPAQRGRACYGLVLEDNDGIPTRVLNLNAVEPRLGSGLESFLTGGGFELAARLQGDRAELQRHHAATETLDAGRLESVVLPVVSITREDLESGRRFSVGVGLNYAEHKEEAGATDIDKTLFPKFVATTGAYAPVSLGRQVDDPTRPVLLGDYEVEIGFVLLEDIDLTQLPGKEAFYDSIAFFTANDVSDRAPIIRDRLRGFTMGKSHPTYQPVGPWMVHGRHLKPKTMGEGEEELYLSLLVEEAEPYAGGPWRQGDHSTSMIRGPYAIMQMIAEIWDACAMEDADGVERPLVGMRDDRPYLPAGSIVLTGTPGGTAIKAPGRADQLRLLVRGGFTRSGALNAYVRHCEKHRKAMGFLHVGDVVETRVQHLGRQRWRVEE